MKTDRHHRQVLSHPARVLDQSERQFFHDNGYVVKKAAIGADWIARLNEALEKLVDKSRDLTRSDGIYDLEADHSHDNPRLRRIAYLDDLDPVFWEFCRDSELPDIAADLFGPDIRFREAMINIKWSDGGQEVKWHQDLPFYPLTNRSVAQFLVALDDVGTEQGPLLVVPRSHEGPFYDHYDDDDNWLGYIPDHRLTEAGLDRAVELTGPAGTVTAHHCGALHASKANLSDRSRPLLIVGYAACDAMGYTPAAYRSRNFKKVVRGAEAKYPRHEIFDIRMPPDWSDGYTSIFEHQEES